MIAVMKLPRQRRLLHRRGISHRPIAAAYRLLSLTARREPQLAPDPHRLAGSCSKLPSVRTRSRPARRRSGLFGRKRRFPRPAATMRSLSAASGSEGIPRSTRTVAPVLAQAHRSTGWR